MSSFGSSGSDATAAAAEARRRAQQAQQQQQQPDSGAGAAGTQRSAAQNNAGGTNNQPGAAPPATGAGNSTDNTLLNQLATNTKGANAGMAPASTAALGGGLGGNGLTGLATGGGSSGTVVNATQVTPTMQQAPGTDVASLALKGRGQGTPSTSGERSPAGVTAGAGMGGAQGTGERTPGPDAATVDPTAQADTANDQMWKDIMAQWQGETGNYDRIGNEVESRAARRAGAANAAAGHGMGGGWASGMGQAAVAGESKRLDLQQQHQQRGLELQMTHLQDQLKRAEASKDRQQAKDIQDMINTTMMNMELVRQGATPVTNPDGSYKTDANGNIVFADQTANQSTPAPPPEGAVDEVLNRTVNGQNAWTALNEGVKNYGWSRSQLDKAKQFAADYFNQYGIWPSADTINKFGVGGVTETTTRTYNSASHVPHT